MPKKRTPTASSNDEQTKKGSDCELMQAVFQHEDNTNHEKFVSPCDTTLQDLPSEIIQCILVRAVAMEVKAMKLAKSVWKAKADLVISRLRTVSLQWSSILSTNFFRNELHRTLDGHAQETIRWEILIQPPIQSFIMKLTSMRDEVFMLCGLRGGSFVLNVYDRSNVVEPKDVIPISEFHLGDMAACSVSNCVYLLNADGRGPSVIRITKDEHQFKTSLWIKHLRLPKSDVGPISVSANGNLIILSKQRSPEPTVVGIYDANGFVQHKIRLSPAIYGQIDSAKHVSSVIQKSNGNLLLVFSNNTHKAKLLEIDVSGRIIHEYQSSYRSAGVESFEDIYGRIWVNYPDSRMELLDSELNLLDIAVPLMGDGEVLSPWELHYISERHEMLGYHYDWDTETSVLVTFRLTEE